jgi:hypothetical protein
MSLSTIFKKLKMFKSAPKMLIELFVEGSFLNLFCRTESKENR